ncbi:hypothetical protein H9N25_02025 [Pedobacter riviphilus]|uniref:Uncharacterized protein n=1 Tax=Pedobacter riviphilus TaxID=2766984 RepID=A0ABX6TPS1_9SPHI|nr:hypothetical protein H9N25_02025 [Pedobacter riviphilus]
MNNDLSPCTHHRLMMQSIHYNHHALNQKNLPLYIRIRYERNPDQRSQKTSK